jgi:hypothetical protein
MTLREFWDISSQRNVVIVFFTGIKQTYIPSELLCRHTINIFPLKPLNDSGKEKHFVWTRLFVLAFCVKKLARTPTIWYNVKSSDDGV